MRGFILEQNLLAKLIVDLLREQRPDIYALPCLRTQSGRVSRAKVMAFLYLHSETQVMDMVRAVAAQHGREAIANVHDAVFFRRALGPDLKFEIQEQMREDAAEVARHRARISREEE